MKLAMFIAQVALLGVVAFVVASHLGADWAVAAIAALTYIRP
jgi:hypothetical protein